MHAIPLLVPSTRDYHPEPDSGQLASLNLSDSASMVLAKPDDAYAPVSLHELASLGLQVRQAWDEAAAGMIKASTGQLGIQFFTRSASYLLGHAARAGLQLHTKNAPVSSWFAHPRTFSILDGHLKQQLGTELVFYFVTDANTVFAFPESNLKIVDLLYQAVERRFGPVLFPKPLLWANGFPYSFTPSVGRNVA